MPRKRLPSERISINHKFRIGDRKGYLIVGMYPDGTPGELFLRMDKTGSTVNGLLDAVAINVSIALQWGVPLKAIVDKMKHMRFEPDGFTGPEFGRADSVVDYVFRWMEKKFCVNTEITFVPSVCEVPGDKQRL